MSRPDPFFARRQPARLRRSGTRGALTRGGV